MDWFSDDIASKCKALVFDQAHLLYDRGEEEPVEQILRSINTKSAERSMSVLMDNLRDLDESKGDFESILHVYGKIISQCQFFSSSDTTRFKFFSLRTAKRGQRGSRFLAELLNILTSKGVRLTNSELNLFARVRDSAPLVWLTALLAYDVKFEVFRDTLRDILDADEEARIHASRAVPYWKNFLNLQELSELNHILGLGNGMDESSLKELSKRAELLVMAAWGTNSTRANSL